MLGHKLRIRKIIGLDMGAVDYLVKPFGMMEWSAVSGGSAPGFPQRGALLTYAACYEFRRALVDSGRRARRLT